jgi:uncharacterized iron-regulated membrane protein
MGIVGLIWIFDGFLGFYLTLPARARGRLEGADEAALLDGNGGRRFWQRWQPAWRIKRNAGASRLNFDLHRAGGLWFWSLLLIMAVSSVSFNLHDEIFEPVVNAVSPLTPSPFDTREERTPDKLIEPRVSLATILANAQGEARWRGWSEPASGVFYNPLYGLHGVRFGDDHAPGLGNAWLYFDGLTGEVLGAHVPGEGSAGDVFHQLQYPLHSGQVLGLPGRVVICITGLAVAMLSITGIIIWARKRRVRGRRRARAIDGPAEVAATALTLSPDNT